MDRAGQLVRAWLGRNWRRALLVLAGVFLAGVPTLFTVFPDLARELTGAVRGWVLALWVIALAATVWGTVRRDARLDQVTAAAAATQAKARRYALDDVLRGLFDPRYPGMTSSYEFTVYVHDESQGRLIPIWPALHLPAGEEDSREFDVGKGATGSAFAQRKVFWVLGDDVSNDTHNLDPEQQAFYAEYRTAASAPIFDVLGEDPVGVITTLNRTEQPDAFKPGGPGQKALLNLADTLQVILGRLVEPEDLR